MKNKIKTPVLLFAVMAVAAGYCVAQTPSSTTGNSIEKQLGDAAKNLAAKQKELMDTFTKKSASLQGGSFKNKIKLEALKQELQSHQALLRAGFKALQDKVLKGKPLPKALEPVAKALSAPPAAAPAAPAPPAAAPAPIQK